MSWRSIAFGSAACRRQSSVSASGGAATANVAVVLRVSGASLSALLMVLTFPGNGLPELAWVCLVPWMLSLRGATLNARLTLGLLFAGLVWMVYLWVPFYGAAREIAPNGLAACALTALHTGSYMVPFVAVSALHNRLNRDTTWSALVLSSLICAVTMVAPNLFAFHLGTVIFESPVPLQLVDLSGSSLLLWCVVVVNVLLCNMIVLLFRATAHSRAEARGHLLMSAVALAALVGAIVGYGSWRLRSIDESIEQAGRRPLTVASVQPNMGRHHHPRSMLIDRTARRPISAVELSRAAFSQERRPDLVVWPENGTAVMCSDRLFQRRVSELAIDLQVPIMIQCIDCSGGEGEPCTNQSRYIGPDGNTLFHHDKQNLVPLFERLPNLPLGSMIERGIRKDGAVFARGNGVDLYEHDLAQIIPAICFDAQSPRLLREGLEKGGEMLIVQSNDRIFERSKIGLFDLAINVVGAVAMRLPMIKVSNSGYGAFLDAGGRLLSESVTPVGESLVTVYSLMPLRGTSTYQRYGDWFTPLTVGLFLFGYARSF